MLAEPQLLVALVLAHLLADFYFQPFTWVQQRNYLWGYGNAGKTIQLVTADEIQEVIDRAHLKVYGEARTARAERLKPLGDGSEVPDWDAFDEPTFERRRDSASS